MIKTMTGTLRYQFAIITAYHVACVLALASEVPHELVRRQADEEASQVVFSNSNPEQNSLNGAPSSDPQKVEVKPSDWRFLKLLQVNSSAPHNVIEAENNPDEWHALASTLLHQSFVADQIMQYQLARLLGDGEPDTNSSYVPYYLDQSARLVAGLNDSAPDDLFQSLGMMVVGCPCLTSSNKGHVSALLVALSDVPAPIVQIDQKVTDKDDDTSGFPCESEDPNDLPPNTQNVEVDYLGGVYDNTDELSSFNSSSMSYLMFLLTGRIDKRSLAVRVDQDMTVVRNCTDDCDITTTEMPTTTPTATPTISSTTESSPTTTTRPTTFETTIIPTTTETPTTTVITETSTTAPTTETIRTTPFPLPNTTTAGPIIIEPIDPIPEEEVDTIVQVIEDVDCFDCNDTMSEYSQSVIIENKYEMDDFEKALSRLQESENSHCVIEAIYSQDANATANATWYYMDQQELVWTEVEEEYESDIHIGHGLVVILPLILSNGSWSYVILVRTYVDKPASPIVQIQQAFVDHSGCGCVGENATEDGTNVANYVSQHFEHRSNYSDLALDLDSMTDYIKMLEAVPPFERQYIDIIAINEIEGPDCNETTTMEPTTTVETTTPEETTTTVETTTTGETTTHSSTPAETTVATEPSTTSSGADQGPTTTEGITTTGSTVTTTAGPTVITTEGPTTTVGPTVTTIEVTVTEQTKPATQAPDTETTVGTTTEAPVTEPPVTAAPSQAPVTETTRTVTTKQTESPVTAAPTTQAPDTQTTTKAEGQTEAPTTAAPAPDTEATTKEPTAAPTTAAPAPDTQTTAEAEVTTKQTESPATAAPPTQAPDTQTTTKAEEQTQAPTTAPDTVTTTKAQVTTKQTESPATAAPPTQAPDTQTTTKAQEQTEPPTTAAPVPAPETTTQAQVQTDAPVTATPAPETTTKAPAPVTEAPAPVTDAPAPVTPAPVTDAPAPVTDAPAPVTPAPVTDAPAPVTNAPAPVTNAPAPVTDAPAPVTEAPVEATTAQFNTSGFSGSVSTYFTIGTSDSPIITIFFGQEIILKMQKEKTFTFVFVLQVRSSGTVTQTFSSMASLIALTGIRQDTPDIRAEVNEEGTDTTTFVSALDRVNKTSTSNNTECLYTMELILQKIQFTNAVTGELYPCDLDNQENAEPPYVEIRDKYNNTHIKRYCYLDRNESIHSFGDQMFGYIVTNGDPNIVPDIRAIQIKEEYCCGGVFYGAFREPLIIPSPDYPQYKPHMRCPFVFRCDEDFEDCVIRLEFESFNLASNDLSRSRRQALNESDFGNGTDATTLAPYVPPTGSDFNRTICAGEDVVRVSQCDSISAINGREFCADNPPSQVYTGYKEVLLYFDSNDERQDQGFVIKFTAKDRRKWIYSDAELNPQCTCAHNLPNQIRKYFRKRNKSKANKAKANNESLRRVRREERENLKERRMAEREGRIPERKRGKMKPQNDGNRDKSDKDKDEKREKDVEGPKSRKMKPQNGGNRDKSDKDKDEKREKDVEGTKSRKMKPQNGGNRDRSDKDKDEKREKDVDGPKRRRMKKMRKTEGGGKNDEDQNKGKNGRDKEEKDDEKPKKRRNRMKAGGKDKDAENQNKKNKDRESKDNANGPKRQRENGGRGSEENAERRKRKRKKTGNSDEGRNENEPKKLEKDRRKDRLQENKAQRLQRKNKNEDEDMPMSRALNARTNRKRQQFPWLVSVVQYELPLVGDKVKDDRKIERLCGGTLLSDRYILTTTSCCTYCKFLWEKKNKKNNSRKKRDAEGEGNNMTNKRRRNKGEAKKGEVKEGEDMDTEKKDNKRKRRKNKKTDDEEGGKNRNRDREEERRNQRKAERKERRNRKNGSEGDDDKKKDKKNGNENNNDRNKRQRNRNRTQKGGKKEDKENGNNRTKKGGKKDKENEREDTNRKNPNPRQKTKKRDPFKKDVAAIIGEGRISINKLGDIQPQKIARIFIPSDCYDKMGKTELNGEPLYPVECPVILKLKKKQKFNRFIKPMCLPIFDKIKINKERAASMGYGIRKSTKREPSKIPAEVINMRVLKKCEKRLKMKLDKTMICTKGKKKSGHMCFYDEGSPLLNVKVTGDGYKQHANLYGALVVPSCVLEKKKKKGKSRAKRDTNENGQKRKRRKQRRRDQETPDNSNARKSRKEVKPQSGKNVIAENRPERKKKLRRMEDDDEDKDKDSQPPKRKKARKLKQGKQGKPKKKSVLQDFGGGDEYNPRKYNKFYIDVWVNIRSYKKWILTTVFKKKKNKACQRPKHFKSVPDIAKKFEIEDPCPY